MSSIAAEIEADTGRANWDKSCYEECRKLLQLEMAWLGDISKNQGAEEIPVLVDWEVQPWIAEALKGRSPLRASWETGSPRSAYSLRAEMGGGVGTSRGGPSPAARKARQAVLDATRGDSQLEGLVRLALGKKTCPEARGGKAVVPVLLEAPVGQGVRDRWPYCTIDGCGKSHHEMLHEVLKTGKSLVPAQAAAPKVKIAVAAGEVPGLTVYIKRELLEGLGIDPDSLEVRIRIQGPGEQEKPPASGGTTKAAAREAGCRRLKGKLLDGGFLASLPSRGEIRELRWLEQAPGGRMSVGLRLQGRPPRTAEADQRWHAEPAGGVGVADPAPTVRRGAEGDAVFGGETHREAAAGGGRAAAEREVQERDEGRRNMAVLTPEGGQCISVRACEGSEHTVESRTAALLFWSERRMLAKPLEVKGLSGIPVRVEETCSMIFPLVGPHRRRLKTPALVVDTLQQYCGFL